MRYFESFSVGDKWEFGSWSVDEKEAIDFALEYDPQPIHTDAAMAANTHFGCIVVSGWQTTLKCIRRFVDGVMKDTAGLASPGVDGIRWLLPVKVGQTLTAFAKDIDIQNSETKPDRGKLWFEAYAENEDGDKVMTTGGMSFIAKKP